MPIVDSTQHTTNAELRESFKRLLPRRLAAVKELCNNLCHNEWNTMDLERSYHAIQNLAGSSGNFGLVEVSDSLFSLEVYLASFIDSGITPGAIQLSEIDKLNEKLTPLIDEISNITPQSTPPSDEISVTPLADEQTFKPYRISYLSSQLAIDSEIIKQFETISAAIVHHSDQWEFITDLVNNPPHAAIIDASILNNINRIGETINHVRSEHDSRLPVIFLSSQSDLNTRLKAMRSGADAFFCTPFNPQEIVERVSELMRPEQNDPYRVLVVEDDRSQAVFCQSILKKMGMQTRYVDEPLNVMEVLDSFNPDLILMDLYMPGCDGAELTALIRERADYIHTPIVFLSGEKDLNVHLDALSHGGDDFLSKPVRPKHLISTVKNRIKRAREMALKAGHGNPNRKDTITGLYSRPYFLDQLNEALNSKEPLNGGLLYIEIDDPNKISEKTGYSGADDLTRLLSTLVGAHLNKGDIPARFSDHSFIALVPTCDTESMLLRATQLQKTVENHLFEIKNQSITITISIGIYAFSKTSNDPGASISKAEKALKLSQSKGGNCSSVYELPASQTDPNANQKHSLLDSLNDAIDRESFEVLYQPMVSLQDQPGEQYQALIRLRQESGKLTPAASFIPLAEEHDLILQIDKIVLSRALTVLDEHHRKGKQTRLFLSQSHKIFDQYDRLMWLDEQLRTRHLSGRWMCLEFRMEHLKHNLKQAQDFLAKLSQIGLKSSVSNFGADSDAFQILKHLPVDYVKVSSAFIKGLGRNADANEKFSTLVEQAHEEGKTVIAPMIEDAYSVIPLWSSGVDYIQGNFVQRPDSGLHFDFSDSAF